MPKLQFLDSSPVTAAERAEAAEKGRYLAVRKPKRVLAAVADSDASAAAPHAAGANIFFGGAVAPGTTAPDAASAVSEDADRKPGAFLGVGTSHYDGRHSEGNRFIVDQHL